MRTKIIMGALAVGICGCLAGCETQEQMRTRIRSEITAGVAEYERQGMSPEDARLAYRREVEQKQQQRQRRAAIAAAMKNAGDGIAESGRVQQQVHNNLQQQEAMRQMNRNLNNINNTLRQGNSGRSAYGGPAW